MEAAGLHGIQARASAHGEYCTGYVTAQTSFHQSQTDFTVVMQVDSLEQQSALVQSLEQILAVIDRFTSDPTQPSPGLISIGLQTGEAEYPEWLLHFEVKEGEAAREQGLHGEALYEALEGR